MVKDPIKALERLEKDLEKRVAGVLLKHITRIRDRMKMDLLAGGALKKRTRGLPVVRRRPRLVGSLMEAGVFSPPDWAGVHIGPRGTAVTIAPKGGKFLAIPTDFVKKIKGHPVGPKQYGGTVVFGGIIWGRAGWGGSSGLSQRRAAGEKFGKQALVPLFILKGSVVVRRRIDPRELVQWVKAGFLADLKKVIKPD